MLSADGTKVVFHSYASNPVAGDDGGASDIFLPVVSLRAAALRPGAVPRPSAFQCRSCRQWAWSASTSITWQLRT